MIVSKHIPFNYIIRSIYIDIFIVTVFSAIAFEIHIYTSFIKMPLSISTFLGTTISLVLSFNLSHSYDRWWEARKIWGEIVNDSRALVLQLQTFTSNEDEKIKKIGKYQIAWVNTLSKALRTQDLDNSIEKYLNENEYTTLKKAQHQPLLINTFIKEELKLLNSLNDYQKVQIDTTLMRLISHMGKAERIKNTVFPKEYQLVLHMSIYFFLGFLSISLANLGHHWEILLLPVIAIPFFLLEKTAKHLQDPFNNQPTDVAISSISRTIEINILSLLNEEEIPKPLEETDFYLN